ncbi:hypothetical protein [Sterolibacterium denitrificans]|uniref:hypothetical protein n=1 Tax=Sterolibacterium denitrificans TaxID=157592 RepID=UPI0012B6ABB1|nr:hypothetical protein [Sterolibacterium denitrificans]
MKFDSSSLLSIDPEHIRRTKLAVGVIALINAFFNFFFPNPASLSTGRLSWIYRSITEIFGPYGYPAIEALIGLICIAIAISEPKSKPKE